METIATEYWTADWPRSYGCTVEISLSKSGEGNGQSQCPPKSAGSHHRRRFRWFVNGKKAGREPLPDHLDRSAQLPPVPTFALSGGDRGTVAGRHRITNSRHCPPLPERECDPRQRLRHRRGYTRSDCRRASRSIRHAYYRDRRPARLFWS